MLRIFRIVFLLTLVTSFAALRNHALASDDEDSPVSEEELTTVPMAPEEPPAEIESEPPMENTDAVNGDADEF